MKTGDMVHLGQHRLMCGDSTNPEHVAELLRGDKVDCVLTSPPYLNMRVYGAGKTPVDNWRCLVTRACSLPSMQPHAQMLVVLGLVHDNGEWSDYWTPWLEDMRAHGWRRFGFYIWNRRNYLPGNANGRLPVQSEFIFHLNRRPLPLQKIVPCVSKPGKNGDNRRGYVDRDGTLKESFAYSAGRDALKYQSGVLDFHPVKSRRFAHSAQLPSTLQSQLLRSWAWPQPPTIYDPFAGSGNVLVAAEAVGGRAVMIEKEPDYCEMIVRRHGEQRAKVRTDRLRLAVCQ